jgi:hypothetical protein
MDTDDQSDEDKQLEDEFEEYLIKDLKDEHESESEESSEGQGE